MSKRDRNESGSSDQEADQPEKKQKNDDMVWVVIETEFEDDYKHREDMSSHTEPHVFRCHADADAKRRSIIRWWVREQIGEELHEDDPDVDDIDQWRNIRWYKKWFPKEVCPGNQKDPVDEAYLKWWHDMQYLDSHKKESDFAERVLYDANYKGAIKRARGLEKIYNQLNVDRASNVCRLHDVALHQVFIK
jgi:hypothetical protein